MNAPQLTPLRRDHLPATGDIHPGPETESRAQEGGPPLIIQPVAPKFQSMRRALKVALFAAVMFPIVYLLSSAYSNFEDRKAAAADITLRSARIAEEHALKLFDLDAALTSRLVDALGDQDDLTIKSDENAVHQLAERLGGGYPQISTVSVLGSNGDLLASSMFYPAPKISVENRDDFRAAHDDMHALHVVGPILSPLLHTNIFTVSQARVGRSGEFLGTVSIAMRPGYFNDFYKEIVGQDALVICMVRADGAVLASYPPAKQPSAILPGQALMPSMWTLAPGGILTMQSTVNGESRIVAFHKLDNYDIYIAAAYPMTAIWAAWGQHMGVVSAATLLPSLALWIFLLVSLRRLASEEAAWRRLSAETDARAALELAGRESERLTVLGNLVSAVAHDFNNLLMAISAQAQTGIRGAVQPTPELNAIMRAVGNGEALTRRLLGVARKQPLRQETLHVPEWAHGFELVKTALGDAISFRLEMGTDIWSVFVDASELELAILNVAVNARDAMPKGGSFTLSVNNVMLAPGMVANLAGDYVCVRMSDTGRGMEPEIRARAFEPFFSTKPLGGGNGLGLSQIRAFCERSGGAVTLHSEPQRGTTLTFYLPRARAVEPVVIPQAQLPGAAEAGERGRRVLLVEDDDLVAEAQEALLEILGHTVLWVSNPAQALQALASGRVFDVVLSDVQMPGGATGVDLAEQLRHERPELPVILLTGYAKDLERLEGLDVMVFAKPVDAAVLHECLLGFPRLS